VRYLAAILALGLVVAWHELGHLVVARLLRIRVTRYSLGFGPPIVSFRSRGTDWRISALPLGGYVVIHGMNPHTDGASGEDRTSYASRPAWQRLLVLAAGSLFNALLAVAVLVWLFVQGTHVAVPQTIGVVEPGSAAARALLRPGDAVTAIDGQPLGEWRELVEAVLDSPGRPLTLEVRRGEETFSQVVTPRPDAEGGGRLGIRQQYVYREHTFREAVPLALGYLSRLLREGAGLVERLLRGKPGADLASPVLLVKQASDAASVGWDTFLRVLVHLSLALALFNLLPFPGLDGGRMVFVAVQAVTGRKVPARAETLAHGLGFGILVALVLWVALRDVRGLFDDERPGPGPEALEEPLGPTPDGGG
jgi:regulator of sigma E protease